MLTDLVTRALSHLSGSPLNSAHIKGKFRYAYASDDGRFVAILTHDVATYVVDLQQGRYCVEWGGSPRGFMGHVLEMEGVDAPALPWLAYSDLFDLDLDSDELTWRSCPEPRQRFRAASSWRGESRAG